MTWILWKLPCKATTTNLFSNPGQDSSIGYLVTHSLTFFILASSEHFRAETMTNAKKKALRANEWLSDLQFLRCFFSQFAHIRVAINIGITAYWQIGSNEKMSFFNLLPFDSFLPLATGQWGGGETQLEYLLAILHFFLAPPDHIDKFACK